MPGTKGAKSTGCTSQHSASCHVQNSRPSQSRVWTGREHHGLVKCRHSPSLACPTPARVPRLSFSYKASLLLSISSFPDFCHRRNTRVYR
ncbi:hypothetical protein HDV63DRAFT_107098 [Trichoderma sp. SZMC 28014]